MPKLHEVLSAVRKVRLRLRVQAALQGLVYGLLVGAVLLGAGVVLRRFGLLQASVLRSIPLLAAALGGCGLLGVIALLLRRIDALEVAARIDKSHALHDRLASALQFVGVGSTPAVEPQRALRELAIADAERVAQGVSPSRAAPFTRPARLSWLGLSLLLLVAAWSLKLPRPTSPVELPKKPTAPVEPRLTIESDLLEPEKEELRDLIKQAEQAGDKEALELLKQMQKLLEQVERGELSRKQAFEMLAELERRLQARSQEGALEELKERLRKAGSELGEAKLAKELGQALLKEDLDKAQKELKKLAAEALSKLQKGAKSKEEKDALAKAFDRAAEAMKQQNQKPEKDKDKANERELDKQKDQWKDKTRSEELTRRLQELKDEERRLKKKLEENPQDEETERRLKKTQRELEQLEREKQEREETRRELEQLERDMQRAAEEMRKQLEKMTPEQRKALEKMAEDLQRMQQQMKQMQQRGQGQQQMRSQMTVALGSIKQVLRRIARSGQGQDGQQGQQGQNGQGQGQGQGQNGQSMKDYMNRAKGKGSGSDNEVLVEGDGNDKDGQKVMLLGQGNDPVIIPGLGGGQGNQGQGQQGQGQGGERPGNQHDPNMLGNATQIDSKRRLTRVYGKEAAGPTRSETILGAAEKGFATQPYRSVYRDYSAVSEKVMSQQRVPPGYRFYVKRYFQMIKPRE
jgi:hypothetical protein